MSIETTGFDALQMTMAQMASMASNEAGNAALRAGAEVILKEIKAQALIDPKYRTGNLYQSLKIGPITKTYRRRRKGDESAKKITLGAFDKAGLSVAPHAHLVEFGHGGPAPAPAHPFVRPSYDKKKDEAVDAMRRVLRSSIKW